MRLVLRLIGKCELTLDSEPVQFKVTRKVLHVLGLVATAPRCFIGRNELMEAAWPLSDKASRVVLIFKWRRSLVDALEPYVSDSVVLIGEQDVSLNTECIDIDYQQCCSLAKIALTSDNAFQVLEAGTAFDAIAEDRVLLLSFPSAFLELREQFDKQRKAVVRRAWQAEAFLYPESQTANSIFEIRLRQLGDDGSLGEPDIPFKSIPGQNKVSEQTGILRTGFPRLAAAAVISGMIAIPIIFGSISTPTKQQLRVAHGANVNNPMASLSNQLMYQLSDPRTKRSAATAICVTPKNLVIVAGNAILTNGDHQNLLVMLTKTGQSRWITKLTDAKGIRTTPKQLLSTESGRIYVASVLSVERNNTQKLAPGSYLAVSVFSRDGQRLFERVHLGQIEQNASSPIRITSDLKGGIHAFALSAREHATVALHVPAGPPTNKQLAITGYPKDFRMTDAIADNKGHLFVLGHLPVKTSAGERLDWHIQAFDKAYKTLWSRDIAGDVHQADAPLRGVINAMGDLIAYGPLPSQNKRNRGHNVATMVTISPSSGEVILRNSFNFGVQDPNFALRPLTVGKSAAIAVLYQPPDASDSFSIHRFGIDTTDTALTMSMQFPGNKRVNSIVSFYINSNGVVTSLLQRSKERLSTTALTYVSMFIGRGIETGDLSASKSYAYNTGGGGLIAGHYDNQFCVYDFRKLQ